VDEGYPKDTQEDWPGVDFDRIDAAVAVAPDSVYFFRGSMYVRVDLSKDGKQIGTRDLIKRRWAGMIFEKIDTGVYWKNSKVYFFHGDEYIRYDMSTYKAVQAIRSLSLVITWRIGNSLNSIVRR
jgi:hypothetical protein